MKLAASVEDGRTQSTNEDQDCRTTNLKGEPERCSSVNSDRAKHKTGYKHTCEGDRKWVFYVDGSNCVKNSIQRTVETSEGLEHGPVHDYLQGCTS